MEKLNLESTLKMSQLNATDKVNSKILIGELKEDLCKKIGISRPTLLTRLKKSNWKLGEIKLINELK